MKVEGEAPDPDIAAAPLLAAVCTVQVSEPAAVSPSVADRVGADHAVGDPSSDIVTVKGPAPWVMPGATGAV